MAATRITIIGGGSYSWGPLFLRDIFVTPALAGSTVVLHDTDPQALDLVYRLGKQIIETGRLPFRLEKTGSLEEALQGAKFVILTITTGGLEAMRHDLEIPARYGIRQSVGDTVGPGGLARALRNIPVVVAIARQMERQCPEAWLLNYSNPMSTLCRAVTRETRIRTIGLCHEWHGVRHKLARWLAVEPAALQARIAGINHLIWLLELKVAGRDMMPRLLDLAEQVLAQVGQVEAIAEESRWSTVDRFMVKSLLLQLYGALPAAGDRHVAEFFPNFLNEAAAGGWAFGIDLTSVEERYAWRKEDERLVRALLSGRLAVEPFMQRASGEAADEIIAAATGSGPYAGIMNLPNKGQIANLPPDVIVETMGLVDSSGAYPLGSARLPPAVQSIVGQHVANQELIVEAAVSGDKALALQALLADPLVELDPATAGQMLAEMLAANEAYLPHFANTKSVSHYQEKEPCQHWQH